MCACRRHLSLELSLGIVFFTNIVLSLAALTYIVSGINTDIFTWAKDYLAALKDDDSAVNTKASTHIHFNSCLSPHATAMLRFCMYCSLLSPCVCAMLCFLALCLASSNAVCHFAWSLQCTFINSLPSVFTQCCNAAHSLFIRVRQQK